MYKSQTLSIDKQNDLENYIQLQAIALNIDKNYSLLDSIVIANQEFLIEMAQDTLMSDCEQAQRMLEIAGIGIWDPVVYPPTIDNQKSLSFDTYEGNSNNGFEVKDYLELYPNPARDNIFVEYAVLNFDSNAKNSISIYTEKGEFIKNVNIEQPVGIITINIRNFMPGVYFVKLNNTTIKFTKM